MGAKILSRSEIIARVKSGDIKISYYCLSSGNPEKGNYPVTCISSLHDNDDGQSDAWKLFLDSLEEDSLRLCVGPYALIEHRTYWRRFWDFFFNGRKFFTRKNQEILNLLENSGELCLYPNENVLVGTNESITLKNKIGGALFATVRNTDVGLPHISTTIDPGWSGRLQIGLVNPTRSLKKLDFMEAICKVRFHEHEIPCCPQSVTQKPHALGWKDIEDNVSRQFFPRRKETATKLELKKFNRDQVFEFLGKLAAIFIPVIAGIWSLYSYGKDHIERIDDRITENKHNIDLISKEIDLKVVKEKITSLEKKVDSITPATNEKESAFQHQIINATIGQDKQTININFEHEYHNKPDVFVVFDKADNYKTIEHEVQLTPQVRSNSTCYNSASITFTPKNLKQFKAQNLNLHVFIVPKGLNIICPKI